MDLSDNYLAAPFFPSHDVDENQYREYMHRDQMLSRLNSNILISSINLQDNGDRINDLKTQGACHGCGHLGHSRPNCPYKDYPGWIARGKRNHPLDVVEHAGSPSEEICHGCGHIGHSRPVCPYKDLPGYFPYGHRRVPLDISNYKHHVQLNSGVEFCHGCGIPGHSRPQCPYKDVPGWASKGQRRTALDVSQYHLSHSNSGQGQNLNHLNSINSHSLMEGGTHETNPSTDNESSTNTPMNLQSDSNLESVRMKESKSHKYDTIRVPRIPSVVQSTLTDQDISQALTVGILLDPTKVPNLISTSLFNHLCTISEVSISRRIMILHPASSLTGGVSVSAEKPIQLSYYVRLRLHFTEINLSIQEDFYVYDFLDDGQDDGNAPHAYSGLQLGYYTIFQNNLFSLYADKFASNPSLFGSQVVNSLSHQPRADGTDSPLINIAMTDDGHGPATKIFLSRASSQCPSPSSASFNPTIGGTSKAHSDMKSNFANDVNQTQTQPIPIPFVRSPTNSRSPSSSGENSKHLIGSSSPVVTTDSPVGSVSQAALAFLSDENFTLNAASMQQLQFQQPSTNFLQNRLHDIRLQESRGLDNRHNGIDYRREGVSSLMFAHNQPNVVNGDHQYQGSWYAYGDQNKNDKPVNYQMLNGNSTSDKSYSQHPQSYQVNDPTGSGSMNYNHSG